MFAITVVAFINLLLARGVPNSTPPNDCAVFHEELVSDGVVVAAAIAEAREHDDTNDAHLLSGILESMNNEQSIVRMWQDTNKFCHDGRRDYEAVRIRDAVNDWRRRKGFVEENSN